MPFQTPTVWNSTTTLGIAASSSGANLQFGFLPQYIRVENLGSVDIFAKFGTTSTASTWDVRITTCAPMSLLELRVGRDIGIAAMSLGATSTATSAYNVYAIG